MQKVILSFFCPALVAIGLRIAFVLFGFSLFGIGHVYEFGKDFLGIVEHNIAYFDTFTWDSSWPYWILVVILTFLMEMIIWEDNSYMKSPSIYKKIWYFCISFICISIIVGILYSCIGWVVHFLYALISSTPSIKFQYLAASFVIGFPLMMIYSNEKKFSHNFIGGIPGANIFVCVILWFIISLDVDIPKWIVPSIIILYNLTIIVFYSYNTAIHLIEKNNKKECCNE